MEIVLNIIVNFTCILTGLWNMSRIMGIKKDNYILRSLGISALAISQAFVSLIKYFKFTFYDYWFYNNIY